jgi:hypothetical protein
MRARVAIVAIAVVAGCHAGPGVRSVAAPPSAQAGRASLPANTAITVTLERPIGSALD